MLSDCYHEADGGRGARIGLHQSPSGLPGAKHEPHVPRDRHGDVRLRPGHQRLAVKKLGGRHHWKRHRMKQKCKWYLKIIWKLRKRSWNTFTHNTLKCHATPAEMTCCIHTATTNIKTHLPKLTHHTESISQQHRRAVSVSLCIIYSVSPAQVLGARNSAEVFVNTSSHTL